MPRVTYGYDAEAAERQRWEQYLICKERGHTPSGVTTASVPPKKVCKFCGCYFWTEYIDRESNAPADPDAEIYEHRGNDSILARRQYDRPHKSDCASHDTSAGFPTPECTCE